MKNIGVVITIEDYMDEPRSGVATYGAKKYHFSCIFDHDKDDYSDLYSLVQLSQQDLAIALERWDIFLRWRTSFNSNPLIITEHPALASDRSRYEKLSFIYNNNLATNRPSMFVVQAKFERELQDESKEGLFARWLVHWSTSDT